MRSIVLPRRVLVAASLFAMAGIGVNACSGKTSDATTPSSTTDGGPGTTNPDCPATDPKDGTACTKDGLLCEYGDDYNPLCNTIRVCSGTRWASPIIYGGGGTKCPSTVPTVPPNPPECPAARASIPDEQSCTTTKTTCNYDGASCTCGVYCPSYPIRQRDCDPDAGITTSCCDTTKVAWHCFDGPKFCATPRPRIGTACTKEGDECAVAPPAECGQAVVRCEKGVWTVPNVSCPISTARAKKEIAYADEADVDRLHAQTMNVSLATYRYKSGDDARHLGFIIEDMPEGSPAVLASRDRVDLYGYVSMAVASLQHQQREIDALKGEVARLSAENAAMKRAAKK